MVTQRTRGLSLSYVAQVQCQWMNFSGDNRYTVDKPPVHHIGILEPLLKWTVLLYGVLDGEMSIGFRLSVRHMKDGTVLAELFVSA